MKMPLYRAMTEVLLMAGAPRGVVIINGTIFVTLVFILHAWYVIPLNIALHYLAVYLTKKDSQFFECFQTYRRTKDYYGV